MLIIYQRLGLRRKSLLLSMLTPRGLHRPLTKRIILEKDGLYLTHQYFFSLLIRMVESTNKGLDPWNIPQRLFSTTLYLVLQDIRNNMILKAEKSYP